MATTYEEDIKTLDALLDQWDGDSIIDKSAPNESAADNMRHHAKYLRIFTKNTINIGKAEDEYKEMRRLRAAFYDGSITEEELKAKGWGPFLGKTPKTQTQKEELLDTDPLLLEIQKRKKVYETIVKAADYILKEVNSRHWSIKAYMEWEMRIRNG